MFPVGKSRADPVATGGQVLISRLTGHVGSVLYLSGKRGAFDRSGSSVMELSRVTRLQLRSSAKSSGYPHDLGNLFVLEGKHPPETVAVRLSL